MTSCHDMAWYDNDVFKMEDCSTLLSFYQYKCGKCDPHCELSVCGSWAGLCLWSLDAADNNHRLTVTGQGSASCWVQLGHTAVQHCTGSSRCITAACSRRSPVVTAGSPPLLHAASQQSMPLSSPPCHRVSWTQCHDLMWRV